MCVDGILAVSESPCLHDWHRVGEFRAFVGGDEERNERIEALLRRVLVRALLGVADNDHVGNYRSPATVSRTRKGATRYR